MDKRMNKCTNERPKKQQGTNDAADEDENYIETTVDEKKRHKDKTR